ncbi:predicted protein [Nematostella vectensis]|uniref:G-protein coupled receptors family 1 profile domain-containing protein n=1 Tax=Nematostella vectensis TaxID=45351 RepID=A7SI17_NEMVE|nr:melanopsin [Nematostella vectensis]EDO36672.1 predicted protein [Nematostella vectensis]|eukprot:XP_001628735.1 predicted protein [Nematostella vectensis]
MNGIDGSNTTLSYNAHSLPLSILTFILSTGGAINNGLLLLAIFFDPCHNLRTPSSVLVTNLAITDLLNSLIAGYGTFVFDVYKYKHWEFNQAALLAIIVSSALATVCGTCCIMLMMAERYMAVIHPFFYKVKVKRERVKFVVALTWIYSLAFNLLPIAGVNRQLYGFILCHLHVTIPALIIGIVYPRLIVIYRKRLVLGNGIPVASRHEQTGRERKFTSAILAIVICFYLSFLPYYVALNIIYFHPNRHDVVIQVFIEVCFVVLLSSNMINPIVYALRVPKYRKAIQAILGTKDAAVGSSTLTKTRTGQ